MRGNVGRIRTIKPEFFTHERLFDAEIEEGLPLRLAFAGLWTCCDREGRFKWRPRELKLAVLPYDQCDFSRVLDALATRGFLVKYASATGEFGYIPSWKHHQFVNGKEPKSDIPEPLAVDHNHASATREPHVKDASVTRGVKEGKGREGKGREDASATREENRRPPDADSGSELAAANWLLEELGVVADNSVRRIAAESIRLLAREGGTVQTASEYILAAGRDAKADGETINRFWFSDQRYRPQKAAYDRNNVPQPKIRLHRPGESL